MRRIVVVPLTVALCLTSIALGTWAFAPGEPTAPDQFVSDADFGALETIDSDAVSTLDAASTLTSGRPVYRYSVIPGGAYTASELRSAIKADPIVAAHYQDLDQSKLQVRIVAHDQHAYVSYRKGDEVFWTKTKVLLRQGETIITDGTKQIRAKCGNCISLEPLLPTAAAEPEVVEFDRLADPVAAAPAGGPTVALISPASPVAVGAPAGAQPGAPVEPLAAGQFAGGTSAPLAAGNRSGGNNPDEQGPPVDVPGPRTPLPPFTPEPPGDSLPPLSGDPPLDQPPPVVPPGSPVAVPEPGIVLLITGGSAALLLQRRRSRKTPQ